MIETLGEAKANGWHHGALRMGQARLRQERRGMGLLIVRLIVHALCIFSLPLARRSNVLGGNHSSAATVAAATGDHLIFHFI